LYGQRTREDKERRGVWTSIYNEWLERLKARAVEEGSDTVEASIPPTGECHRNPRTLILLVKRGWRATDGDHTYGTDELQEKINKGVEEMSGITVSFGPCKLTNLPTVAPTGASGPGTSAAPLPMAR
jgi:hypothetical protein